MDSNVKFSVGASLLGVAVFLVGFSFAIPVQAAQTVYDWVSINGNLLEYDTAVGGSFVQGIFLTQSELQYAIDNDDFNAQILCRQGSSAGNPINVDTILENTGTFNECDSYLNRNVYFFHRAGGNISAAYGQYQQDNWVDYRQAGIAPGIDYDFQSGFNSILNTRFLDVSFTNDDLSVNYIIDENEVLENVSERNPSQIKVEYTSIGNVNATGISQNITPWTFATSTEVFSLGNLQNGDYTMLITFDNIGVSFGSPQPFPNSYVYLEFNVSGNVFTIIGNAEFYDSSHFLDDGYQDCSLTALSGCLINAAIFLFVPSDSALDSLSDLNSQLAVTFPFAYAYDFTDAITSLYDDQTAVFPTITIPFWTLGDITLLSQSMFENFGYSSLIRNLIAAGLWAGFGYAVYRRTLKVFNTNV